MRVEYEKHYYGGDFKYVCLCGHKFKRKNRDWFTLNPYNTKSYEQLMAEGNQRMALKERYCPKCTLVVIPVSRTLEPPQPGEKP